MSRARYATSEPRRRKARTRGISRSEYELTTLQALNEFGGRATTDEIYRRVEQLLWRQLEEHHEERECHTDGGVIWKNEVRQAHRELKSKRELADVERACWEITDLGRQRLAEFKRTGKDPDRPRPVTLDPTAGD